MSNIDRYIGFYTHKPFWAGTDIFQLLPKIDWEKEFTRLMQEVTFVHETNKYSLKVCRDGMFLFKLSRYQDDHMRSEVFEMRELVQKWSDYLAHLNAILILFESAFLEVDKLNFFDSLEITIKDAFGVMFEDGEWKGNNVPMLSVASQFQRARFISSYPMGIPLIMDTRLAHRFLVSEAVFRKLFYEFDIVFQDLSIIRMIAKLMKSLSEFKIANYDTSLVIAWFIIESLLNKKWDDWLQSKQVELDDNKKRINRKRFDTLLGRDYTISVISNILELSDILTFDIFEQINQIRTVRNKIVHQNDHSNTCSAEECCTALRIATNLIEEKIGFKINLNLSYSVSGL